MGTSGGDDETCKLVKQMVKGAIQAIDCSDNSALLTFNNDLSTNKGGENPGDNTGGNTTSITRTEDGWTGDEPGTDCTNIIPPTVEAGQTACSVCLKTGDNTSDWFDSNALCGTNQVCVNGVCTEELTGTGCLKNSDCKTIDPDNCGNGEYFCDYNGNVDSETGPTVMEGSCVTIGTRSSYPYSVSSDGTWSVDDTGNIITGGILVFLWVQE